MFCLYSKHFPGQSPANDFLPSRCRRLRCVSSCSSHRSSASPSRCSTTSPAASPYVGASPSQTACCSFCFNHLRGRMPAECRPKVLSRSGWILQCTQWIQLVFLCVCWDCFCREFPGTFGQDPIRFCTTCQWNQLVSLCNAGRMPAECRPKVFLPSRCRWLYGVRACALGLQGWGAEPHHGGDAHILPRHW